MASAPLNEPLTATVVEAKNATGGIHDEAHIQLGAATKTFDTKTYDVTPFCLNLCCGSAILTLGPEEAAYKVTNPCGSSNNHLPYGELGSIDLVKACCGCISISSALTPAGPDGKGGGMSKGCGCEIDLMEEIYQEMKRRQRGRGDVAMVRRAEQTGALVEQLAARTEHMDAKLNAIIAHLGLAMPAAPQPEAAVVHHKAPTR